MQKYKNKRFYVYMMLKRNLRSYNGVIMVVLNPKKVEDDRIRKMTW